MKKLIFRNIFKDISTLFIIISLALTLIVWVIQAVNFLDFVTEDGHSFTVYFKYSLLTLPKIFTRLFPFAFLISMFFTIRNCSLSTVLFRNPVVIWVTVEFANSAPTFVNYQYILIF